NNRMLVRRILMASDFEVLEAGDAVTGIQMALETRPDLILMDIQMPGMDGLSATSRIRSTPEIAGIPIVALTAHAMPEQQDIWLAAGMNGHLIKPIKPEQLRETIYSHLEKAGGST
ncbi:MAG: response regulator, partial [Desulfococcaceae bacterium]